MIDPPDPLDPLEADEGESEVLLDPRTSERKYWRDNAGLQREVWRPGKLPLVIPWKRGASS